MTVQIGPAVATCGRTPFGTRDGSDAGSSRERLDLPQAYGFIRTDISGLPAARRCTELRIALQESRCRTRAVIRAASAGGFTQLLSALDSTPAVAVAVPNLHHLEAGQFSTLIGCANVLDVATGRWWEALPHSPDRESTPVLGSAS